MYEPLYNFWLHLQCNGDYLHLALKDIKSRHPDPASARELFLTAKEKLNDDETLDQERAVAFYIINKCSFSGLTESSSFSEQASDANFSMRGIEKLPMYTELIKNWYITNVDYRHMLGDGEKHLYILTHHTISRIICMVIKVLCTKNLIMMILQKIVKYINQTLLISYNSDQLVKDRF